MAKENVWAILKQDLDKVEINDVKTFKLINVCCGLGCNTNMAAEEDRDADVGAAFEILLSLEDRQGKLVD